MLVCLTILTFIFFFLTLYNILQANLVLFHIHASPFWSLKLLDTSTAATLFVTIVGALLVRHQFALGILPRVSYTSATTIKQDAHNPTISFETWRVEIRNTGLGSAIINSTDYSSETSAIKEIFADKTFNETIKELTRLNLTLGSDYWLGNMTSGFSLSPKDEFLVFEIKTEHLGKLKTFVMTIYFQGQLGDKYRSEISLLPRF